MSTLRERMDRLREVFTAQVPAEIKAVMSGATEDLCASDILERLPIPGSPLPAVELATGQFAEFINQDYRVLGAGQRCRQVAVTNIASRPDR